MSKHVWTFFWLVILPVSIVIIGTYDYSIGKHAKSAAEFAMLCAYLITCDKPNKLTEDK